MSEGSGRKALLVVDPSSDRAKDVAAAVAALEAGGITLIRRETTLSRLPELILSLRKQIDCVVVAGGDAALSAGAIALRDTGLPLGVLPWGAENDLAGSLHIPDDPEDAAAVILAGHARRITLGSVNGRPFFNAASVGLTVRNARHLAGIVNRPMGSLRFRWAAFRLLMRTRRFSAIIRCGSVVHRVRTVQVTIGNGRFFAGAMPAALERADDTGTLSVYSLEPAARWGLIFMRRAFLAQDADDIDEARLVTSPVVEVVTRLPQPISADGHVVTVTPARFSILPEAVQVYVPAEHAPTADQPPEDATASVTGNDGA